MINKVIMLCKKNNDPADVGLGDCFVVLGNTENFVIDCGSEELADKAYSLLKSSSNIVKIIITHPDDDHYKGITKLANQLIDNGNTVYVYYAHFSALSGLVEQIENKDKRRTIQSITNKLNGLYKGLDDKVSEIKKYCENTGKTSRFIVSLINPTFANISYDIILCGPNEYELDAIYSAYIKDPAHYFDNESCKNTLSLRMVLKCGNYRVIICGDYPISSEGKLKWPISNMISKHCENINEGNITFVVPHHGKLEYIRSLIEKYKVMRLCISDNTSDNKNGGIDTDNLTDADRKHIVCISKEHNRDTYTMYEYTDAVSKRTYSLWL